MTAESPGTPATCRGDPGTRLAGGDGEGDGDAPAPVPLSAAVTVPADVTTEREADRAPTWVGSKATLMVHEADAGTVAPAAQVPPLAAKSPASVPVTDRLVMVIVDPPELVRVTVCAVEGPAEMSRDPKLTLDGVSPGLAAVVPVPCRALLSDPAEVVTCRAALRAPT